MIKLIYPKLWQTRKLINYLLLPFSLIYFLCSKLRTMFAQNIQFAGRVICVGNISVGGTGKTQIIVYLAKTLAKFNIDFVIIAKSYGGSLKSVKIVDNNDKPELVGDEAVILMQYGTVIAAKKIKYAYDVINTLNPRVILVDDGMQNPTFYKDYIILTIDAIRGFGNELLIPAGPLRESKDIGLKKVNSIVVIGKNENFKLKQKAFHAKITPLINNLDKNRNYIAFCGIGNPEKFLNSIKELKLNLLDFIIFPDHHLYSSKDIENLRKLSKNSHSLLITTEKDYVKTHNNLASICLKTKLNIDQEEDFITPILELINRPS